MEVFPLIYRCAVEIKPKQPVWDWLNKIESPAEITLHELQQDCNLYLVPDYEEEDDIEKAIKKYIESNYQGILLNELNAWYIDPSLYPKLTYVKFLEWFEITSHTMIYDMVNEPLDKDD